MIIMLLAADLTRETDWSAALVGTLRVFNTLASLGLMVWVILRAAKRWSDYPNALRGIMAFLAGLLLVATVGSGEALQQSYDLPPGYDQPFALRSLMLAVILTGGLGIVVVLLRYFAHPGWFVVRVELDRTPVSDDHPRPPRWLDALWVRLGGTSRLNP